MKRVAYFTFGYDHIHMIGEKTLDRDTVVRVEHESPRDEMMRVFGSRWSDEYISLAHLEFKKYYNQVYDLATHRFLTSAEINELSSKEMLR